MRGLLIYGAAELACMARYYATEEHGRDVKAFVVDSKYKTQEYLQGIPVIEWPEAKVRFSAATTDCFVAIGYRVMRKRRTVYEQVQAAGYNCINLVSPASHLASSVQLGQNNLILPHVVIEPGVRIGANNIIWSSGTICHDTVLGNHNFLAANVTLAGHTHVGNGNFIGFSATILQHINIGNEVLIGAQALVRDATRDSHKYWGVPAREQGPVDELRGICIT